MYLKNPPKPYTRNQYQKLIAVADDLEALMEIARLSIGHTLWMADLAKAEAFNDNHHFWLNHINSLTLLGMASDRMRDLFMEIIYGLDIEKYIPKMKKAPIGNLMPWDFPYPFSAAKSSPKNLKNSHKQPELNNQLDCLFVLTEAISVKRRIRNGTVHKVATRAGILTTRFFNTLKNNSNGQNTGIATHNYEYYVGLQAKDNAVQPSHGETLDSALTLVIEWYHDLAKATSIVFDIEDFLRMDEQQITP